MAHYRFTLPLYKSVLVLVGLLVVTACGLSGGELMLGHEAALEGSGVLRCTDACRARGQCGTTVGETSVILGHTDAPATSAHNLLFTEGSQVALQAAQERTLEPVVGGEPFRLRFYQVAQPEPPKAGWVAGWCVAAP